MEIRHFLDGGYIPCSLNPRDIPGRDSTISTVAALGYLLAEFAATRLPQFPGRHSGELGEAIAEMATLTSLRSSSLSPDLLHYGSSHPTVQETTYVHSNVTEYIHFRYTQELGKLPSCRAVSPVVLLFRQAELRLLPAPIGPTLTRGHADVLCLWISVLI